MDKLLVLIYVVIINSVHVETIDIVPIVVNNQYLFVDKYPDQFWQRVNELVQLQWVGVV